MNGLGRKSRDWEKIWEYVQRNYHIYHLLTKVLRLRIENSPSLGTDVALSLNPNTSSVLLDVLPVISVGIGSHNMQHSPPLIG